MPQDFSLAKQMLTAVKILEDLRPEIIILPASNSSGRSVLVLNKTFGTPKIAHSSGTVPLSLRTQKAPFCKRIKSIKPMASINLTLGFCAEILY